MTKKKNRLTLKRWTTGDLLSFITGAIVLTAVVCLVNYPEQTQKTCKCTKVFVDNRPCMVYKYSYPRSMDMREFKEGDTYMRWRACKAGDSSYVGTKLTFSHSCWGEMFYFTDEHGNKVKLSDYWNDGGWTWYGNFGPQGKRHHF